MFGFGKKQQPQIQTVEPEYRNGKPQVTPGIAMCPLFQKDLSECCHKCNWYIMIAGKNPQTGDPVEPWGCAMSFNNILQIESTQQIRQMNASIDRMQNAILLSNANGQRLISQLLAESAPLPELPAPLERQQN